jgi:hypothetical protein
MKLLDHTLTDKGYTIRIWLDEIAPDYILEYTRLPYKAPIMQQSFDDDGNPLKDEYEPIEWSMTQKQYEQEQIDQAMTLATQTLAQLNPQPKVISQDKNAIAEQQEAIDG